MRPGSSSRNGLTSSAGLPPGTGIRPGSGRKAPGTARLRTGIAPSGPGTQAAQGIALNASINVSDRPVTGHGVMGMRSQGQPGGRIVQDAAYYIGLLRNKIKDINEETIKLRTEIDQQSKDNSQYSQLERRYETLLKSKEQLEGQLADYNLALDKTRSATDPEDVQQMALHMAEKNRQSSQDLDRIFMQRKQRETDTTQVEEQIENIHRAIQKRLNDLEPGKLRAYNEFMMRQRELQDRLVNSENRLNEINNSIRAYESDEKNNSLRKEYMNLEKRYQSLRKDADSLQEELEIANLDPKEAHTKFIARVNLFKQNTKNFEEKIKQMKDEIINTKRNLDDLNNSSSANAFQNEAADQEDLAKYELLVKRDQDMTTFIDSFEESRNNILQEQRQLQFMIIALLEHIGKGIEDTTNIPTIEAMNEMENAKQFKEKNLITAQKTMESLLSEKKKREKELDILKSSEPKLVNELNNLTENIHKMKSEMEELSDLDRLRKEFNDIKLHLSELKTSYIKRRDTMRQQIQSISLEHEAIKKSLNANDIARELDDTEKRLKHAERNIFDLKEFVEVKSRETDFEHIKAICLKLTNTLNELNVKSISNVSGYYGTQAKW